MKRYKSTLFALALLLCLSGCAPAQEEASADEPEAPAVVEPVEADIRQEPDSTPAETSEMLDAANIPDATGYPDLAIRRRERERMSYEEYFSEIREAPQFTGKWGLYTLVTGRDLKDTDGIDTQSIDENALYLYREKAMEPFQVVRLPVDHVVPTPLESDKITYYRPYTYGQTEQWIYCLTDDGKYLRRVDPVDGTVDIVYQPEVRLCSVWCRTNLIVFSEEMPDGTFRIFRLYEPDGTVDVLDESLQKEPSVGIMSNCEFYISWANPEMVELREEHKEDFWAEYWTDKDDLSREIAMNLYYKEAHPDYVDDGSVPPYDEDLLPLGSYDPVVAWVWEHYAVPERLVRYRNTLTGYHKTMYYTYVGKKYFFLDGTQWVQPYEVSEDEIIDGSPFWLYLPSED